MNYLVHTYCCESLQALAKLAKLACECGVQNLEHPMCFVPGTKCERRGVTGCAIEGGERKWQMEGGIYTVVQKAGTAAVEVEQDGGNWVPAYYTPCRE